MADITLIARKLDQVLHDNADIREQLNIVRGELALLNAKLDSLQRQLERMNDRIRKLEDAR